MANNQDFKDRSLTVRLQAKHLASSVRRLIGLSFSDVYLETIFVPFLAQLLQFNEWEPLEKPSDLHFKDSGEFLAYIIGSKEALGEAQQHSQDTGFEEHAYDLTICHSINIYERIVYRLFGISVYEISFNTRRIDVDLQPDTELRKALIRIAGKELDLFPNPMLLDFLPLTLLEGLANKASEDCYPYGRVHWLADINNDSYIFYLAYLKQMGSKVIGQVHGGFYSQTSSPPGSEIAESILADYYHQPNWEKVSRTFPNVRSSRNLFINLKNSRLAKRKIINNKRMLVILGLIYAEKEPTFNRAFTGTLGLNSFYQKHLASLNEHFSCCFDFKLHPRQKVNPLTLLDGLKEQFKDSKVITEGSAVEVAREYSGVIHLAAYGTSIMELSTTRIPQYVYLGPDVLLNKDYEEFLWVNRLSSTKPDCSRGSYVEVNNRLYRAAYGASYLYPLHIAGLIRSLARKRKSVQGRTSDMKKTLQANKRNNMD